MKNVKKNTIVDLEMRNNTPYFEGGTPVEDNSDVPLGAQCDGDNEFVLLAYKGSYYSKLVKAVAWEKGARWKYYDIDFAGGEHRSEWYVKRNKNATVPTMYVGKELKVVLESSVIMDYIDKEFKGAVKL